MRRRYMHASTRFSLMGLNTDSGPKWASALKSFTPGPMGLKELTTIKLFMVTVRYGSDNIAGWYAVSTIYTCAMPRQIKWVWSTMVTILPGLKWSQRFRSLGQRIKRWRTGNVASHCGSLLPLLESAKFEDRITITTSLDDLTASRLAFSILSDAVRPVATGRTT